MLAQRYDPVVVRNELQRDDLWWDQLLVGSEMIAFFSYFLNGNAGEMKLDKLYVHQNHQRKGYGRILLDRLAAVARGHRAETLVLAVNKNNHNAISAYHKYGFRIAKSVMKDIGGGFAMDDYLMVKDV